MAPPKRQAAVRVGEDTAPANDARDEAGLGDGVLPLTRLVVLAGSRMSVEKTDELYHWSAVDQLARLTSERCR